jgi:2-methylcitrate dehydratase PrpD
MRQRKNKFTIWGNAVMTQANHTSQAGLTDRIARFIVETDVRALPAEVLKGACNALIDTVGVGLIGSREPVSLIAQQYIRETAARGLAAVWGSDLRASVFDAAYANAIAAHALDFDDSHPSVRGHASAPTISAVLALGEALGAAGTDVLAAYALGLETAGKLGRAVGTGHYMKGWHATSTMGTFAAAAASARLWRLDLAHMRIALSIAASQLSGLVRNFGTMTKPFHAGRAARAGMLAAWLAKNGQTADAAIFDGANDVVSTYSTGDGRPLAELVAQLGAPWEVVTPGNWVKRWPCCYAGHRAIGGTFKLLEQHAIRADEINSITVASMKGSDTALIHTNPQTGLEGKFSVEYMLAASVLDRRLVLETFTDAMVQRPAARALMKKVRRRTIDDGRLHGLDSTTDVEIDTARGIFKLHVEHTPGSLQWPMTDADRRDKFLGCAEPVLGGDGAEKLLDLIRRCAELPDAGALPKATVPAA